MTKFIYIICIHTLHTYKCIFKKYFSLCEILMILIVKSIDSASSSMISCHHAPYFLKTILLRFSYVCAIIIALRYYRYHYYHFNHLLSCLSSQNSFRIMHLLRKFYSFFSHENIRLGIGVVN